MSKIEQLCSRLPQSVRPMFKKPILIKSAKGVTLTDSEGKQYLDMFAGIVTVSVGHCHPKVNAALKAQMDKLWHTTCIYLTEPVFEYSEKLLSKFPKHLDTVLFVNSGSEANDLALELARLHTGRYDIISVRNGYHGMTQTVQGVTNLSSYKQPYPTSFGMTRIMCPDPYLGPWGGKRCRDTPIDSTTRDCSCQAGQCKAGEKYANQVKDVLKFDVPASTGPAAFLAEAIQGVGGTVQFPRTFWPAAYAAVQEKGGLCISDEVQTGFGRLGSDFWGFQANGVSPDIVTMAKGMGNGFPIGGVVTTKAIAASLAKAAYFNTFGGNPLAATVGKAVLDVIEEEKLQENAATVGTYFLEQLASLASNSSLIGDVRGKGLLIGVELVDPTTGGPLPTARAADVIESIKDKGVLVGKGGLQGNVLRIKPPLCVTKDHVDQAIGAISAALAEAKQ